MCFFISFVVHQTDRQLRYRAQTLCADYASLYRAQSGIALQKRTAAHSCAERASLPAQYPARVLPSHARVLLSPVRVLPSHARVLPSRARVLPSHARVLPSHARVLLSPVRVRPSPVRVLLSHARVLPSSSQRKASGSVRNQAAGAMSSGPAAWPGPATCSGVASWPGAAAWIEILRTYERGGVGWRKGSVARNSVGALVPCRMAGSKRRGGGRNGRGSAGYLGLATHAVGSLVGTPTGIVKRGPWAYVQ
jgi:hypothetical protein